MKLLKDFSIEVDGEFTIIHDRKITKIISPGRIGYYINSKPTKIFKKKIKKCEGFLVEDADYFENGTHVEYTISIANAGNKYILADMYSSSEIYAETMINYYSKMVKHPKWVGFSVIKGVFSFSDGKTIIKITDDGGFTEVGPDVGPVNYLVTDHFNYPPAEIPQNIAGEEFPDGSIGVHLHPLEPGRLLQKDDNIVLVRKTPAGERYCIYDGYMNFLCTRTLNKATDLFEKYRQNYDLFWLGNGYKIVLKKYKNYYISVGGPTPDKYKNILYDTKCLTDYSDVVCTILYDGTVYIAFPLGVISWDGLTALYTVAPVEDVYDAMKIILHSRFIPATDPVQAYIEMHEKI